MIARGTRKVWLAGLGMVFITSGTCILVWLGAAETTIIGYMTTTAGLAGYVARCNVETHRLGKPE